MDIENPFLKNQITDWAAQSGPAVAAREVQAILGIAVDETLGATTIAAINAADPASLSQKIVAARIRMIVRVVQRSPAQLKDLHTYINRALEFLV